MKVINWIMQNYMQIFAIIGAFYSAALMIVKLTRTPKDDEALEKVGAFIKALSVVFGLDTRQGLNIKTNTEADFPTAAGAGKILSILFLCMLMAGCAGLSKLTPQEKGLVVCDDFMTQHFQLQQQSQAILADAAAPAGIKKIVAEEINPKINKLHGLIVDYCTIVVAGGAPSTAIITQTIADIMALFAKTAVKT